jgi:L-seryl-tRNA(Ser) seleniumtransferase
MHEDVSKILRTIPSMDKLLALEWVEGFCTLLGRKTTKLIIEGVLENYRNEVLRGNARDVNLEFLYDEIRKALDKASRHNLTPVVNATGVIVHTNLGRSCLADDVASDVRLISSRYSNLEYDLERGKRGHRYDHVEWILCQLTGAEAALVVNNNAAAVLLCLTALAGDGEAIISRGELIEIGESFRIPDIMSFSGAKMIEVGTTNRTHLYDYERAINENTRIVLKVHPSNYRIVGFHLEVGRRELTELAHSRGLLVMEDLGSGFLVDLSAYGLKGEPTIGQCIEEGVDIVTFSGDKLLGGPQIGGIVGKKDLISKLKKHPLLRALRVDKMTLAALESTLRIYLREDYAKIPTLAMIMTDLERLKAKAYNLANLFRGILSKDDGWEVEVIEVKDLVGGGAFPDDELRGFGVAITPPDTIGPSKFATLLRQLDTPVVANVDQERIIFHVRTMGDGEDALVSSEIEGCLKELLSWGNPQ